MKHETKKIAGIAAVAALFFTATACTPPHQIDSDQKLDTASEINLESYTATPAAHDSTSAEATTTVTATTVVETVAPAPTTEAAPSSAAMKTSLPKWKDCFGAPTPLGDQITLACADNNDYVEKIKWTEITGDHAVGTGDRVRNNCDPDCASGKYVATEGVTVELSKPVTEDGELAFSILTVDGQQIAPLPATEG